MIIVPLPQGNTAIFFITYALVQKEILGNFLGNLEIESVSHRSRSRNVHKVDLGSTGPPKPMLLKVIRKQCHR